MIKIPVSVGEFLDKLTILQIKFDRIKDEKKKENILNELTLMTAEWVDFQSSGKEVGEEVNELFEVNESLWEIEDAIREKEAKKEFDQEFIGLARSVYKTNDRRAELKRIINQKLNSGLIEEKYYKNYH